jgi:hypothetical protein
MKHLFWLLLFPAFLFGQKDSVKQYDKLFRKETKQFRDNLKEWDVGILPGESPSFLRNVTPYPQAATSWGAIIVGGAEFREKIRTSAKRAVTVYVFDTGEPDHKDLQATKAWAKSYTGEPALDGHGHSSHVGGTIAGNPTGGLISPAAGLIDAGKIKVVYLKVLSNSGSGSFSWILNAATEALTDSKKRIAAGEFCIWNFSLGGGSTGYQPLDAVFTQAKQAGILVFCAAGNSYNRGVNYPGNYKDNIAIAAGKQSGQLITRDDYSTYGAEVFFIEPGSQIMSTITGQQYAAWSGTSMATPHACAIAAVVASLNPTWTGAQVLEHMRAKAFDLPPTGRDENNGWGWHRFTNLLDGSTPTPPPTDPPKPVEPELPQARTHFIGMPPGDVFFQIWRTQGQTMSQPLKVTLPRIEVTSKLYAESVYDKVQKAVANYFRNSMLIVRNTDDYATVTAWTAIFLEYNLNRELEPQGIKIKVGEITGEDVMARSSRLSPVVRPTAESVLDVAVVENNKRWKRWIDRNRK